MLVRPSGPRACTRSSAFSTNLYSVVSGCSVMDGGSDGAPITNVPGGSSGARRRSVRAPPGCCARRSSGGRGARRRLGGEDGVSGVRGRKDSRSGRILADDAVDVAAEAARVDRHVEHRHHVEAAELAEQRQRAARNKRALRVRHDSRPQTVVDGEAQLGGEGAGGGVALARAVVEHAGLRVGRNARPGRRPAGGGTPLRLQRGQRDPRARGGSHEGAAEPSSGSAEAARAPSIGATPSRGSPPPGRCAWTSR